MKVALVYLNNDKLIGRGAGYIAMAVYEAGHYLDFFDTAWTTQEQVEKAITSTHYDVLMVSITSFYYQRMKHLVDTFKSHCNSPVLVGGPHATVIGNKMLIDCPSVDCVCVGEGEVLVTEYLNYLENGSPSKGLKNIAGICYRTGDGHILENKPGPPTDLHSLKPFNFEYFNPKSVVRDGELIPGFCYVQATRGCPFRCSYCCNSYFIALYGKGFLRTQNIDTVIAELKHLKANYPVELFYFGDEMILFDRAYATELFQRVHDEIQMPYGCMFRVEAATQEMVDVMKNTGCRYVSAGIECGDEKFRKEYLNRRMTNDNIITAFRRLRGIPNVWITSYNMRGYPVSFDDRLTSATVALNKQVAPNHVQTTWFYPIPGTPMHDYCVKRDLIDDSAVSAEDYFLKSIIRHPVSAELDKPLYGQNGKRG